MMISMQCFIVHDLLDSLCMLFCFYLMGSASLDQWDIFLEWSPGVNKRPNCFNVNAFCISKFSVLCLQTAIPILIGTKFDDFVQLPPNLQWTIVTQVIYL
jgi:TRAP-type C4-dicarboxylate transport system permease small subunit